MKEMIESLKEFGLSDYEAKAYIALVRIGSGTVTEISQVCDVPRSNLYEILEKLTQKGFAETQKGRPVIFKAVEYMKILNELEKTINKKIATAKNKIISELSKMGCEKSQEVVPTLVWGIRGVNSILKKIEEMIKRAKKEIIINIPDISILDPVYIELENANNRGVKIKIVTQAKNNIKKYQKIAIIRTRKEIHGIDMLCDDTEVIVAPSIPVAAAWVDNPEIALHVHDFLNIIWKDAQVLK